jgi:hypothetical protein
VGGAAPVCVGGGTRRRYRDLGAERAILSVAGASLEEALPRLDRYAELREKLT